MGRRRSHASRRLVGVLSTVVALVAVGASASAAPGVPSAPSVAPAVGTVGWHAPRTIEPAGGYPSAISCPSAGFCAEVDVEGAVAIESSGTWSSPHAIDQVRLIDVACASSSLCVAIDALSAFVYNGSSWSRRGIDSVQLSSVSCAPGTSTCVAVDVAGRAFTYSSGSWSSPTPVARQPLSAVSCASTTTCVAVDASGNLYAESGGAWSGAQVLGGDALTAVDCPTSGFCVAGDDAGTLYSGPPQGPYSPRGAALAGGVASVSCTSATACVALTGAGATEVLTGSSWSPGPSVFAGDQAVAVSCSPSGGCTAVSYGGQAAAFQFHGWQSSTTVDPPAGQVTAVACASAQRCTAVDDQGRAITYNGSGWSRPRATGLATASAIACVGGTCVAVGGGAAVVESHGAWGHVQSLDGGALTGVSCASAISCRVTDASNHVLTYTRGRWSAPSLLGVGPGKVRGYTAIGCASGGFCIAGETNGHELLFGGGVVPFLRQVDTYFEPLTGVACARFALCVAVDEQGNGIAYHAAGARRSWSRPLHIDLFRLTGVACTTAGFCLAVDDAGGSVSYYAGHWTRVFRSVPLRGEVAVACASRSTCVAVSTTQAAVGTARL